MDISEQIDRSDTPEVIVQNAEEYIQLRRVRSLLDARDQAREAIQAVQSYQYDSRISSREITSTLKAYIDAYCREAKSIILNSGYESYWTEQFTTAFDIPRAPQSDFNSRVHKIIDWELPFVPDTQLITYRDLLMIQREQAGEDPEPPRQDLYKHEWNPNSPVKVTVTGIAQFLNLPDAIQVNYNIGSRRHFSAPGPITEFVALPVAPMIDIKELVDDVLDASGLGIDLHEDQEGELFIDELKAET
jgi:hypothetical protein